MGYPNSLGMWQEEEQNLMMITARDKKEQAWKNCGREQSFSITRKLECLTLFGEGKNQSQTFG